MTCPRFEAFRTGTPAPQLYAGCRELRLTTRLRASTFVSCNDMRNASVGLHNRLQLVPAHPGSEVLETAREH
jgi:hypothetical protein